MNDSEVLQFIEDEIKEQFDLLGKKCKMHDKIFKNNHGLMIHLGKLRNTSHAMHGLDAIIQA